MVSSHNFLQTGLLLIGSMVAVAASMQDASPPVLRRIPVMPRIPSHAKHLEVLRTRSLGDIDVSAVIKSTCLNPTEDITLHDEAVAQLSICGSMIGTIQHCEGSLTETVGEHGTASFALSTVDDGATMNLSKTRWIQCVHAARAACPTGSLSAVCAGGASKGNVAFTLTNPQRANSDL